MKQQWIRKATSSGTCYGAGRPGWRIGRNKGWALCCCCKERVSLFALEVLSRLAQRLCIAGTPVAFVFWHEQGVLRASCGQWCVTEFLLDWQNWVFRRQLPCDALCSCKIHKRWNGWTETDKRCQEMSYETIISVRKLSVIFCLNMCKNAARMKAFYSCQVKRSHTKRS